MKNNYVTISHLVGLRRDVGSSSCLSCGIGVTFCEMSRATIASNVSLKYGLFSIMYQAGWHSYLEKCLPASDVSWEIPGTGRPVCSAHATLS